MSESTIYTDAEDTRKTSEVALSLAGIFKRSSTVAYILNIEVDQNRYDLPKMIDSLADPLIDKRVRLLEKLALTVRHEEQPWRVWFIETNQQLGDVSPATLIQSIAGTDENEELISKLQFAADEFAANRE